ncbi:MAG: response regulator [Chlorobi bacterium]|nr:response regulator [Chlorobiota bacterium]
MNLTPEELRFTSPSGKYRVKFEHIEDAIFKTTINGYYDIEAFHGHIAITDKILEAVEKNYPGKIVYFIEDATNLRWLTPKVRKVSILKYREWKHHGGSFVYGANKLLFSLNKLVSLIDYFRNFHFAASEKDALQKIRNTITDQPKFDNLHLTASQRASFDLFNKIWEEKKETITIEGKIYRVLNKDSWEHNSENGSFSFRCSLIEGNIFFMKLSGFQNQLDVDRVYEIAHSIIIEFGFNKTDNKIFSVGDLRDMKGISLRARNRNTKHEVEFRDYSNIFITVPSPVMKVLIKIHRTLFPSQYTVWRVADSIDEALGFVIRKHGIEGQDLFLKYDDGTELTNTISLPRSKKELRALAMSQHETITNLKKERADTIEMIFKSIGKISSGESYSYAQPEIDISNSKIDKEIFSAINLLWEDFTEIMKEKETAHLARIESDQRFSLLINSVPNIAIQGYTTEGKVVFWNDASVKVYGYERDDALGKNLGDLIIPDAIKSKFEKSLENAKNAKISGELTAPEELILKNNKGEEVHVFSLHTIVRIDKLEPIVYCLDFDLSERKKVEEKLREAQNNLERRVEERTAELVIAKEKAEESDRLKTAFLANMSHEIRTPLNAIMGFSGLLSPKLDEEVSNNYIHIINNSGLQLLNIINDIIDIAKIEAGQINIEVSECRVNSFLKELLTSKNQKLIEEKTDSKEIKLIIDNGDENFTLQTDPTRLKQVMTNLVNNAIKFTERGKIEFGYYLPGNTNNDKAHENEILFFVKDTGIGINKNEQEFIFERFRQVENSLTKRYGGTGLGLAISKSLVEKLGGRIWVESEEGKGSEFYFTVPFVEQKGTNPVSTDKKTGLGIKEGITILIAEDEPSNFHILEILLNKTKSKLIWARNGQEAIDLFKENKDNIDIVLMDIQMPIKNGLAATREIKEAKNDVPILAQTAYALAGDRERFLKAGCDDYISKPIEKELLFEKIGRLMA